MKIDEANGKRIVQRDLDDTHVLIGMLDFSSTCLLASISRYHFISVYYFINSVCV